MTEMVKSDLKQKKDRNESVPGMFRYLTGLLEQQEQGGWRILAALSLVSLVVDIFSFSAIVYIIDQAARQASAGLIAFTLCMMAVSIAKCFLELYKSRLSNRITYGGAQKLSVKIYEALIKEDLRSHYQKDAMQALTMVRQDTVTSIQIVPLCIDILVSGITLAGYGAVLIYVSGWLGIASSILLVLIMAGQYLWTRDRMNAYGAKSREYAIRANAQITIAYGSFKEMKIDDRSAFVLEKYQQASSAYAQVQSRYHYESNGIILILRNSAMCAIFAVLAVILAAGSNLPALLTPMATYITALIRMLPMIYSILSGMYSVEFARKPFVKLKEMVSRYEELKEEERRSAAVRQKVPTFKEGLSVRNLTFAYNEQTKIFEDASIDIPVGGSIAVIGASGVGKTTFLDLILGLLKPQGGHIYFDDYDIVSQTDGDGPCRASLGELVSYIPQTIYLNGETVQHNVAFFSDDADIDSGRVESCLKCAQIWEDVQKMPEGVHTLIGENGTAISGGQRQRIALARALYKDFELLVMDEATAALDMETERAVIDSIRQIRAGKTLLMVTHHMSLANECDFIYKIEDKKIVQVKGGR